MQYTLRTVSDRKVIESIRDGAEYTITEQFPEPAQHEKVKGISLLETAEQFEAYLRELEPYLLEFPLLSEKQIQKLFPKTKKLKAPDLQQMDRRYMSHLSWMDISTNKLFMVYPVEGKLVGIEGKYTPTNKKGYCFICNRQEEIALFSAMSKKRPEKSSSDYYRTVGNYLCADGHACNSNITDLSALEKFIESVIG